jgi:hypothetical protein
MVNVWKREIRQRDGGPDADRRAIVRVPVDQAGRRQEIPLRAALRRRGVRDRPAGRTCCARATRRRCRRSRRMRNLKAPYVLHVTFSAGNMKKVAQTLPHGLVIADNDASGTGERVAREIGWPYWMSDSGGGRERLRTAARACSRWRWESRGCCKCAGGREARKHSAGGSLPQRPRKTPYCEDRHGSRGRVAKLAPECRTAGGSCGSGSTCEGRPRMARSAHQEQQGYGGIGAGGSMGKGSSGGNRKSEVRDMQVLDSRQDARADARAASGAVSAFAALGVLASAGHVQEARACNREGGRRRGLRGSRSA